MGGYGAARLGFKYPELFGSVSIMSGAILPAPPPMLPFKAFSGDEKFLEACSPRTLVTRNAEVIARTTRVRLIVGETDTSVGPGVKRFHEILTGLKVPHEFDILPGIPHNPVQFYSALGARTAAFYKEAFSPGALR